jgi:8-oxo-dGTP pyrophosphatase MutT (NUDIX family)
MMSPGTSPFGEVTASVWVHIRDRRLLVVRPHDVDVWFLPGGLPEGGESLAEAAAREVAEEIGVQVDAGRHDQKDEPVSVEEVLRRATEPLGGRGWSGLVCHRPGLRE